MTYHTNHSWCRNSIWNDECFDGEVMVHFGKNIGTDSICEYTQKVPDPDLDRLTESKPFFDEEDAMRRLESMRKVFSEKSIVFDEKKYMDDERKFNIRKTITLRPDVIQWLEENVKDRIIEDSEDTPTLADIKGWAIGNEDYNSQERDQISVFFARQVDALKFIRRFSVFTLPTFYFDYFNEDRREMESSKILEIINSSLGLELKIEDLELKNDRGAKTSTNMDYLTFEMLDWEKESEYDDIRMNAEEIKTAVEEIYLVEEDLSRL